MEMSENEKKTYAKYDPTDNKIMLISFDNDQFAALKMVLFKSFVIEPINVRGDWSNLIRWSIGAVISRFFTVSRHIPSLFAKAFVS